MADITILAVISREFDSLAHGPLLIDGALLNEARPLSLGDVKELLLARETSAGQRDSIWREIAGAAQKLGGPWPMVALGLALPGLANLAKQFARDYAETNSEDMCAEVVAAFLEALRGVDIDRPAILTRMYWATYRAVRRAAYGEVFAARAGVAAAAEVRVAPTRPRRSRAGSLSGASTRSLCALPAVEPPKLAGSLGSLSTDVRRREPHDFTLQVWHPTH